MEQYGTNWKKIFVVAGVAFAALFSLIAFLMIILPIYSRYQTRADAQNRVHVNNIKIKYYEQQKGIAQQKAQIRYIESTGVRRAQDEIAKTLTPLYVQWEAIQAQLHLANSPSNSTIYIPVGANGVPLVSTTDKGQVAK